MLDDKAIAYWLSFNYFESCLNLHEQINLKAAKPKLMDTLGQNHQWKRFNIIALLRL